MSRLLDPKKGQRRQKYEFCVVLCVRASTWKDGLLSRFTADDKRMEEGKGKAECRVLSLIVQAYSLCKG